LDIIVESQRLKPRKAEQIHPAVPSAENKPPSKAPTNNMWENNFVKTRKGVVGTGFPPNNKYH
jgi:hypothetical protein